MREGRRGPSRTDDLDFKQELVRQGKEPAPEPRDRSLSKLRNRAGYALGSEWLDVAEEHVSAGRGDASCDRQLWAEGTYKMETSRTPGPEVLSQYTRLWTLPGAG